MGTVDIVAAGSSEQGGYSAIILFAFAGLFAGGAWSAYQAKKTWLMVIAGALAAVAFAGGVLWMMGEMS